MSVLICDPIVSNYNTLVFNFNLLFKDFNIQTQDLLKERKKLKNKVRKVVHELGPQIFGNFKKLKDSINLKEK